MLQFTTCVVLPLASGPAVPVDVVGISTVKLISGGPEILLRSLKCAEWSRANVSERHASNMVLLQWWRKLARFFSACPLP